MAEAGGRVRYVTLDEATPTEHLVGGAPPNSGPQAESVAAAIRAAVLASGRPLHGELQPTTWFIPSVVGLLCLAVLVAGPAPGVGTRWYWFWIFIGVPYGLGVLAWLLVERPWSARAAPPPEPGGENRRRGLTGLLISIAAAIVAGLLVSLLGALLGTGLISELPR